MKKQSHHTVSPEKVLLYTGTFILLIVLAYLVANSGEFNTVTHLWVPFLMAGIALILTSRFIR